MVHVIPLALQSRSGSVLETEGSDAKRFGCAPNSRRPVVTNLDFFAASIMVGMRSHYAYQYKNDLCACAWCSIVPGRSFGGITSRGSAGQPGGQSRCDKIG